MELRDRWGETRKLLGRTLGVKFPLADWIDEHEDCHYHLGSSGMAGSIRHPLPTSVQVRKASPEELRDRLARHLRVDPQRVFLTAGATEANTSILLYLARHGDAKSRKCRFHYPEYPPLFASANGVGWLPTDSTAPAGLAVISRPRNPEGRLDTTADLERWSEGARHLLVDETFREFSGAPSIATLDWPRTWITGSFTKFFAGDDLRVGFLVAPQGERVPFAHFQGLLFDSLAQYSLAGAIECLRDFPRIRRDVLRVFTANLAALAEAFPGTSPPRAPVYFDRVPGVDGPTVAQRCLEASVLVCPGSMFGDPSGVRLGLTRRTFPRDLAAYLKVRRQLEADRFTEGARESRSAAARRPHGETDRNSAACG